MNKSNTSVNYEQWHPEADIFDEKERKLIEQIAALAR